MFPCDSPRSFPLILTPTPCSPFASSPPPIPSVSTIDSFPPPRPFPDSRAKDHR